MAALLADIGATKSQLALMDDQGRLFHTAIDANAHYDGIEALLGSFLAGQPAPTRAVLAVAGPVDRSLHCRMTNLGWTIDGQRIAERWHLSHITLLNDLQATAWGLTRPDVQSQLHLLRGQALDFSLPVVVLSPGTGLGQSCILPHQGSYVIAATEGGHKSIAPFNTLSAELVYQHWHEKGFAPSWENWFSGSGFSRLFSLMHPGTAFPGNAELGQQALADPAGPCGQVMRLFAEAVYAEAGNLALQYLAWGGVILAGGIPPKLMPFFTQDEAIDYVHRKNEYIDRLQPIPVAMSVQTELPLLGAAEYARRAG